MGSSLSCVVEAAKYVLYLVVARHKHVTLSCGVGWFNRCHLVHNYIKGSNLP